ncbi:MAG: LemA family protein [Patescibacteria group bacterium]|jgi:LemA protein
MGFTWFLIIVIFLLAIWVIGIFNGLVVLKNRVAEADSDIDVQLKRRHDLIPNLVQTVQGYATHERELLEKVTQARTAAMGAAAGTKSARAAAENQLTSTLKSLFAVAENYPDLKANTNFLALQEELSDTENKIMSSRRFYNANVKDFNTRQETFPSGFIARTFGFKKSELFELTDIIERETPKVDFSAQA